MIRAIARVVLPAALGLALLTSAAHAGGEIRRTPEFLEKVDAAIESGAEWLLNQQDDDGGYGDYNGYPAARTALVYHTLRVCGVPRNDPRMDAAYTALREEYVAARDGGMLRTYTAALVMMAIESHGWRERNPDGPDTRYASGEKGGTVLEEPDLAWMRELVEFMVLNQNPIGAWRYGQPVSRYGKRGNRSSNDYDHSNTQYALLGLKSASRSGVEVDPDVYLEALQHLLDAQEKNGPEVPRVQFVGKKETFTKKSDHARGWGYFTLENMGTTDRRRPMGPGQGPYGSMTAGSLGALVICRSELMGKRGYGARLDAQAEQAIWDGIAWLGQNFSVTQNPNHPGWHYYYLYALERAGVLAGVDWMGEHDWYGVGADYLVGRQDQRGYWRDAGPRLITTCFALLFLKRGTLPVARGAVTPSGGGDSIDFGAAASLEGKNLEDFVDLVVSRWRRASGSRQRAELARGTASVGRRVVLPLLRRMGTGDEAERRAAHALLVDVTGQTFLYDAAAEAQTRFDQLMAWEEWYMARADRLQFDDASGRLVTR